MSFRARGHDDGYDGLDALAGAGRRRQALVAAGAASRWWRATGPAASSRTMRDRSSSLGYEECERVDEADLILLSTFSIREWADKRFIARLGEASASREKKTGAWFEFGTLSTIGSRTRSSITSPS